MASVFLIRDDELVEMTPTEYESEAALQELLARFPKLLDECGGDEENQGLLLVGREIPLPDSDGGPNRWSVDHLFLDREGVPVLVEVKRSSDHRIRREVIGQMLEYATHACSHLRVEEIQAIFEKTNRSMSSAKTALVHFLGENCNESDFWTAVQTNLRAARVRLVFAADNMPDETRLIIEFLNKQMSPAEVYGIQIKKYASQGFQTVVPELVGLTAETKAQKKVRLMAPRDGLLEAVEAFGKVWRGSKYEIKGAKADFRQIRLPGLPTWLHYEFLHRDGRVYAELHLEAAGHPAIREAMIKVVDGVKRLSNAELDFDPEWGRTGGRLRAIPDSRDAESAAGAMKELIELTFREIRDAAKV